jgi:hypothetical protein
MKEGEVGRWKGANESGMARRSEMQTWMGADGEVAIVLHLPYYPQRVIWRPLILPSLIYKLR